MTYEAALDAYTSFCEANNLPSLQPSESISDRDEVRGGWVLANSYGAIVFVTDTGVVENVDDDGDEEQPDSDRYEALMQEELEALRDEIEEEVREDIKDAEDAARAEIIARYRDELHDTVMRALEEEREAA